MDMSQRVEVKLMAWSMYDYWGFVNELRDEGVELADAREAYRDVRDELGRSLTARDAGQDMVDGVLEDLGYEISREVFEPDVDVDYGYGLDDRYLDDEWLDAGWEMEVTVDLVYEE